jgi:catechol 2,3-dioxygenase-like lactoylglutathione lyase family enzyme
MPVQLNHHIVHARDAEASARYLADVLGVAAPTRFGPFQVVELTNGVSLDFMQVGEEHIHPGHYAFLVSDNEFDAIFGRIQASGADYWADPHQHHPGEINHDWGGRGVYWSDPDGHWLEILTVPYGGWPATS